MADPKKLERKPVLDHGPSCQCAGCKGARIARGKQAPDPVPEPVESTENEPAPSA